MKRYGDKPTPLALSPGEAKEGISVKVENTEKLASAFLTIAPDVPVI